MKRIVLGSILLLVYNALANPIDNTIEECKNHNPSTLTYVNCLIEGIGLWDDELNKTYTQLRKELSKPEKEQLKKSQLQWIAFRDAENYFIENHYGNFEGSVYKIYQLEHKLNVIRSRTLQLQEYLLEIEESKNL